jgi:Calcineurin-like phosphoesterase
MKQGPLTERDHFLSVFQSAAASVDRQVVRSRAEGAPEAVARPSLENAAAEVARLRYAGMREVPPSPPAEGLERLSPSDTARICATLGFRYMQAKVIGDTATAERISSELVGATCDPRWVRTIDEYLKFFGPGGTRRKIPYIRAASVGDQTIKIGRAARIGLIGDWGTGAEPARRLLTQLKAQGVDLVIHLGDIYYSGTPEECQLNFTAIFDDVFGKPNKRIPVYSLSGNHDMYCGGVGYYGMIKKLNAAPFKQPASFFCLRTEDASWQFLAMDTGLHDYSPFTVGDTVPWLETDEEEWHVKRIKEFGGKTVLLSHHPLFSAFSPIGRPDGNGKVTAFNPKLKDSFDRLRATGKPIPAWFWGHEHNLCIYGPYLDLARGRCLGHSAIPVFAEDDPYEAVPAIVDPPSLLEGTKVEKAGDVYAHGFAVLTLSGSSMKVQYFEDREGDCVATFGETVE